MTCVTFYTDIKEKMIYNRHVFPFILIGLVLDIVTRQYYLLLSGLIVFALYALLFYAKNLITKIAVSLGGIGISQHDDAMGGGDVKLSLALALFLGALPVLYGTVLASVLIVIGAGVKAWKTTGSPSAVAYIATGKLPAPPMAFGALLGPSAVIMYYILK